MELINCLLLLGEAVIYFTVMAALFRIRARVGIGLFVCVLGVMHFVETYLASVFYVALPFGIISPGSTVLFSGKLMMLLLLYIKEDAALVRQPIYGLLVGNFLVVVLAFILRQHEVAPLGNGRLPDFSFINEMGVLMVWGTTLLFIDAIALILLYERFGRTLSAWPTIRIGGAAACVLTFDHIGFYAALRFLVDAPITVFVGGLIAKISAAVVFSAMMVAYLRWFERPGSERAAPLGDVFQLLTYRERYEALVDEAGRDSLTKLLHRGSFARVGSERFERWRSAGQPLSLLVIDVDHFKQINDRYGHPTGDAVLARLADILTRCASPDDHVFRIGGEEFAILTTTPHDVARLLGEKIRAAVHEFAANSDFSVTVSVGLASASPETTSIEAVFADADRRLYAAKRGGRDRVHSDASLDATESVSTPRRPPMQEAERRVGAA
ncbi:MAG: GGDEF domain-containing protein [Rhizobiales bacterium 65-9]|nr:GGDEF domain-containing protein [Hyphomicrobiales bacterium]OJY36075.1 MAG: GGDEF domain-containing protein [Rhizobiales bacterium 65-9]